MFRLLLANLLMTIRDRQALFWTLFFPLIFVVTFGLFFNGNEMKLGTISIIDQADTSLTHELVQSIKDVKNFTVSDQYQTVDDARAALKKNSLVGIIVFPAHFGESGPAANNQITTITSPANANANSVIKSVANGIVDKINNQAIKSSLPPLLAAAFDHPVFSVYEENTGTRELTYFDFVLIGILGMSLMHSAINGVAISMSKYRDDQILKRITTTPLPTWQFILAEVLSRLVVNFLQVVIILLIGTRLFSGHVYGNLGILFALSLLGAILFQLFGFAIASLTSNTRAAEGLARNITMPMMFLAGVFFSTDSLPGWLQKILQFLPLQPLLTMMRQVGLEQISPFSQLKNIEIIIGWIVLLSVIAVWKFRLSEE